MKYRFLGIDLGTTYSVGAFVNDNGEAETVMNSESEKITPSVVYFENKDSVVVGQPAKDSAYLAPGDVISLVKNVMGKKNPNGTLVTFQTSSGEYSPEVVSSYILRKIVDDANAYLQPEEPITDVVVTVPAYFDDAQRMATDNAISIAGLNRIAMINEPTAAAIYYAEKTHQTVGDLLVYDLGGGTFDVTIVHLDGDKVEVKSTGGLSQVGGSFFDKIIVQTLCTRFEAEHGIDLTAVGYEGALQDLYVRVEKAKIQLSSVMTAKIMVRADNVTENYTLTREELNEIVSDLYDKTEAVMKKALRDAHMTPEQIDKVILVGGSSRIPYIYEHVKEFFGTEPSREVNPNEVVALGAAIRALKIKQGKMQQIVDVCSHGIGMRAWDPKKQEEFNDILIHRNTKLPASVERTYTLGEDNAPTLYISVLEGDYREVTDVTEICEVDVELPGQLKKGTAVCIRLEVDAYQLLHIYIRIPSAGNVEKEIVFDRKSNLTEAEVTKWKTSVRKSAPKVEEKSSEKSGVGGFFAGLFGKKADKAENWEQKASDYEADAKDASGEANGTQSGDVSQAVPDEKVELIEPEKKAPTEKKPKDKSKEIPKIVQTVMADFVGMEEVKAVLRDYKNRYEMQEKRSLFGRAEEEDRCIAICGESGMGLTTAALLAAECLYKFGITSEMIPVVATYDDIVKPDEQQTVQAIQDLFQKAMNGVLIIDEFHTFYDANESAAGMLAVNYLLKAYVEAERKVTLIVSGTSKEIKDLFEKKEKFSRLFSSFTVDMIGYSSDEYVQIMHKLATKKGYVLDNLADQALERHISGESKLPEFTYIHYLEELLDEAKTDVANKASKKRHATDDDYIIIRRENFQLATGQKSLEELLAELDDMVGIPGVKAQVKRLVKQMETQKRAELEGREMPSDEKSMHTLFLGNAGTGKTTVARLLGEIYRELGALTRGHMIEVLRKDLVSEFVGKTAPIVSDTVDKAMGGILFIDEAYSLCRDENDTFGKDAVDTLVPLMENRRTEFMTILAGYSEDMRKFLESNQGLKSRIRNEIVFEDYTQDELLEIFMRFVKKKGYSIEGRAVDAVKEILGRRMRQPDFGNGRGVRNLFEEIEERQRMRLSEMSDWGENEQFIIRIADVVGEANGNQARTVDQILDQLNGMVGLASVKREVQELVNIMQVNQMRKQMGLPTEGAGALHMVFAGNPGTGKTTVARMIGEIYYALGVIAKPAVKEVKRSDLVANYVGQTAPKTVSVVQSALGGVLFIDEAYQLGEGGENDFGKEAISTLVQELENHKDDFVCIAAGYTKDMEEKFMSVNPGLPSRFTHTITFDDYSLAEKLQIFQNNMRAKKYEVGPETLTKVMELFEACGNEGKYANGRGVRNLQEQFLRNQASRIMRIGATGQLPSMEDLTTLLPEDIFISE